MSRKSAAAASALSHFPRGAAGGGDQTFAVALQQIPVEARLAVLPLEAGQRGDAEQVVHAHRAGGQHRHVAERRLAAVGTAVAGFVDHRVPEVERLPVEPAPGCVVALHADDRLDPGLGGLAVEVVGAEDVAVIGHGDRGHAHPLGLGEQLRQLGCAVEHGVLGMHMQVHELVRVTHRGLRPPFSIGPRGEGARCRADSDCRALPF